MWRGAAQWLGWMLGHRQRKHQKRVENREVQEASRRRGDPEAPPRVGHRCATCARKSADQMWPSAAQHNTLVRQADTFGITPRSALTAWHPRSDGSRRGWRHDAKHQFIPFKGLNCQGVGPALLPDGDPGSRRREDAANPGRRNAGRVQRVGGLAGMRAVNRHEQAPRRLRIVEELHSVGVDIPGKFGRRRQSAGCSYALPRHVAVDERQHPWQERNGGGFDFERTSGSPPTISDAWPMSPKPVTSVHACTTPAGRLCRASAARRLSVIIERIAAAAASAGARSNLTAVEMIPVPRALVRKSSSPACAPAFDQMADVSTSPVMA